MASRREQAASARVLSRVPSILSVPRTDPVIIIDLAIVNGSEQPLVEQRAGCQELARVTALETNTGLYTGFRNGLLDAGEVPGVDRVRLFDDQMFARFCGCDRLRRVVVRIAADRYDVDIARQQFLQFGIALDL